jgi:hypothetical protein
LWDKWGAHKLARTSILIKINKLYWESIEKPHRTSFPWQPLLICSIHEDKVNLYGNHGIDEHRWFCLLGSISDLSCMFFQNLICWYLQCGAGEFHWAGFSLSSSSSYLLSQSPPSIHILLLLLFFFFPSC